MKKTALFFLLFVVFSIAVNAQNAKDSLDKAIAQYNKQQFVDAQKTITEAIVLAKAEKWDGLKWLEIRTWGCRIQAKINPKQAVLAYLSLREDCLNALGKDHSLYGIILNGLAGLYKGMSDYSKALPLYLEAVENAEKSFGKSHSEYSVRLNNLALLYKTMGDYSKALPLYVETLNIVEKNRGKNHSEYGILLINLAILYETIGIYSKALPLYLEALENTEKNLGKNHSTYGVCLNGLALLYQKMGEYSKALTLYEESLENIEKSLGKNHSTYAIRLNNIAGLYQSMGDYSKALPLYIEAIENVKKSLGKNHSTYSVFLSGLALLYKKMGEYSKALPLYLESLEIVEKTLGKNHAEYSIRLINLAGLYQSMGAYSKAMLNFHNGIEANKRLLSNNILGLSEDDKTSLIKQNSYFTDILQSLILQFPDSLSSNLAWEDVSFYKSLALKSGNLLKQKLLASTDTITQNALEQLELYQNLVNKEMAKPIDKRSPSLPDYQTKAKVAEQQLLSKSQDFKAIKEGLSATYEDVAKRLKNGEAAIEFTHFVFNRKNWTDTTYYAAYIIKPQSTKPQFVVLFTQKELLNVINMSTANTSAINKNYLKRGSKLITNQFSTTNLYDLVWKKLTPYLSGVRSIYLSPSGYLSKVSFAAMQDTTGQYLSQKYQINYMLSLTDLLFAKTTTAPTSFLLAGGIKYDYQPGSKKAIKDTFNISVTTRSGLRGNTWTYLEGTKKETQKIEAFLKAAQQKPIYFNEDNATEKNIKQALLQSPSVWHIATHGFYIPFEAKQAINTDQNENTYKATEDPMYRSGLILAGGNYAWENGSNPYEEEDGILLAKEVSTMNLSKTQLVVLSACETGLGDLNGKEGVMGLQRALKMAGVHNQITTLWQVPDKETVEFMEQFYKYWLSGNTMEQAFNKTQSNMSKKYATDPSKWGAFVLYR